MKDDKQLTYFVSLGSHSLVGNYLAIIDWLRYNFGPSEHGVNYWYHPSASHLVVKFMFANECDAIAFKLAWQEKIEVTYIDLPSGWKYGFPKIIPNDQLGRIEEWVIANGYPQHEIDQFKGVVVPYRCWSE
jgi:hypothetical protein